MPYIQRKIPWIEKPDFNDDYRLNNDISANVVAHYLLNEGGGSIVHDLSGRGNNGSIGGALWVPGGLDFSAPNDYITCDIDVNVNEATFYAFINLDALTSWAGFIFSRGTSITGFGIDDAGNLQYHWGDNYWSFNGPPLSTEVDLFVAATISASQARLYVGNDNGLTSTINIAAHTPQVLDAVVIGADTGLSNRWINGRMEACHLSSRAKSHNEILAIYRDRYSILAPRTRRIFVPATVGGVTLQVQSSIQSHTSNNLDIFQQNVLTITGSAQLQSAINIELIQQNILSVASLAQLHVSDNIDLQQGVELSVDKSSQEQVSDSVDLLQQNILSVASSIQERSSDNVDLQSGVALSVDESSQEQLLGGIDLIQQNALSISKSTQAQSSDSINLLQQSVLNISTAFQNQTSNNVVLEFGVSISIDESVQDHMSDNLALSEQAVLAIVKAAQDQLSTNLDLTQSHVLTIDASEQLQIAENITLDVPSSAVGYLTAIITITPSLTAEIETLPRS